MTEESRRAVGMHVRDPHVPVAVQRARWTRTAPPHRTNRIDRSGERIRRVAENVVARCRATIIDRALLQAPLGEHGIAWIGS
jgi:hypothetical protein